jgi:putative hydrolase of the HAD superfamily
MSSSLPTPDHRPPQAVVFDFGGVLFRWQPLVLIQQVLPHLAGSDEQARDLAAQVFQSFAPGSDWAEFDRGTLPWDAVRERIARRTGLRPDDVHSLMAAIPPHLSAVQDTVAWLDALAAAGTRLYFLSNMPAPYAEHLQREHAFLKHFQDGVFSCDVKQVKPNDDIFHTAVAKFGIDPTQTLFLDDNHHNITAARRLGWQAVPFEHAAQCQQAVRDAGWWVPSPAL